MYGFEVAVGKVRAKNLCSGFAHAVGYAGITWDLDVVVQPKRLFRDGRLLLFFHRHIRGCSRIQPMRWQSNR